MKRDFAQLADRHFDVLVCGGGIYGAWTAYDAALRGLKVAIVDQGDWASGTSSASSKLIHGGLRYLESLDFKLVKKALREREMLKKAAPHRVWPLRFGVPVFKDSRLNSIRLKLGLLLYDFLAGTFNSKQAHRHFSRAAFAERFPCLNPALLTGGFTYADAQTDDARLVLELIDGALSAGAVCLNYCKATGFIEDKGRVCGVKVQDSVGGKTATVYARQIVNAIGQWTVESECRLTKGVHLILPKVLGNEALLLTAKADGRVFFMIPWYGLTLLGTTDTDYTGDVDQVRVEPEEVGYLLTEANRVLSVNWTETDIIGRYAGLRVLKQSSKAAPSAVSRDWELKVADNGLLTSIGGKITSAREDAAQIVNTLCAYLGVNASCRTGGKLFPWLPDQDYRQWSDAALGKAVALGIDNESAQWLIRRHAKRVSTVFQLIENNASLAKRITPTLPFIVADLVFCAGNEMVVHLEDLLRRRIPLLILAKMTRAELRYIAEIVATTLGWDEATLNSELELCIKKYEC
ncbi:glycerol-3-phosphate dehydrogenase/oxidase [Methylobacter sp.]|uniref:glycerol-3-phosphate dehydrogenase/oxidase n=1 Tax=Methylobacter sp. TaxID=2051955 RepID=UPI0011F427BB|nr:glycerol-3-phosphate dehydrogenase/oxidase [Methylobacter sp.]TAK64316.1 MAG: glycerol-3-phosphate dehydrogenase/oxidase [Methylobacter sp.]